MRGLGRYARLGLGEVFAFPLTLTESLYDLLRPPPPRNPLKALLYPNPEEGGTAAHAACLPLLPKRV